MNLSIRSSRLSMVTEEEIFESIKSGMIELACEDNLIKPDFNRITTKRPQQMREASDVSMVVSWSVKQSTTLDANKRRFPILEYKGIALPLESTSEEQSYLIVTCDVYPPGK